MTSGDGFSDLPSWLYLAALWYWKGRKYLLNFLVFIATKLSSQVYGFLFDCVIKLSLLCNELTDLNLWSYFTVEVLLA